MASTTSTSEKRIRNLLRDAGVHPTEVDPASLNALRNFCGSDIARAEDEPLEEEAKEGGGEGGSVPVPQVGAQQTHIERRVSDLTERKRGNHHHYPHTESNTTASPLEDDDDRDEDNNDDKETDATTAGVSAAAAAQSSASRLENLILRRLEDQTQLILKLDRRVEELSWMVRNGQPPPRAATATAARAPPPNGAGGDAQLPAPLQHRELRLHIRQPLQAGLAEGVPAAGAQQQHQQQHQQQQAPAPVVMGGLTAFVQLAVDVPNRIRASRLGRTVRLYLALRRQQVPDVDARFILKVLVVLAVVAARFSRGTRRVQRAPEIFWGIDLGLLWAFRFHLVAVLGLAAFFVQSGYAAFWYMFFVKEDYPARIWAGEDLDVEAILLHHRQQPQHPPAGGRPAPAVPPPPQPRPPHEAAPPDAPAPAVPGPLGEAAAAAGAPPPPRHHPAWRDALLGGRIPRPDAQRQQDWPAPIRLVIEIGFLLSSFVLSIFPMWQPQAAPEPHREPDEDYDDDGDDDDPEQDDHDYDDRHNAGQLPTVRPPRDPAEYEDDDEEEEDEGLEPEDAD